MNKATNVLLICVLALMATACNGQKQSASENAPSDASPPNDLPFAVGSSTVFIHDFTRAYDSVVGVNDGIRILITEIWYPVNHDTVEGGDYRRATYGDYVFGDRTVHRLMMTQTTFFHLTPDTVRDGVSETQIDAAIEDLFLRERLSFIDAPMSGTQSDWPVIVMTHGDAGSRYNMESVCEYLAAHGYIVIAPEHTGNSPFSLSGRDPALADSGGDPEFRESMAKVVPLFSEHGTYGSEDNYGQSYTPLSEGRGSAQYLRYLDQSLLQRLNDLRATLHELDRMNAVGFAGTDAGFLDLDRIGLMGRSFGGATTLAGLALESRFTSGFAVVPPGWADLRSTLPEDMLVSDGEESVILARDGAFPLTNISKPTVLLSGAEDSLIIGLAAQVASAGGVPLPTPDNPHTLLRQAFESTEAPVVWGLLADSNHSTFGVSGGYWWPELKPNTQSRHFDPASEFELIAPGIAHQMERELALDFFDLTIREDLSASESLLENRYSSEGLILESRNIEKHDR